MRNLRYIIHNSSLAVTNGATFLQKAEPRQNTRLLNMRTPQCAHLNSCFHVLGSRMKFRAKACTASPFAFEIFMRRLPETVAQPTTFKVVMFLRKKENSTREIIWSFQVVRI